jgi:hypothetical protein
MLPAVEVDKCEHLIILGDMLEDLLMEQNNEPKGNHQRIQRALEDDQQRDQKA